MLHAYGFLSYVDEAGYNRYTQWTKFDSFIGTSAGAKVINLNGDKIGLSIKQTLPSFVARQEARNRARDASSQQNFEDKLAKFIKESDERHSDLRKNQDSKRGGRGSRGSRMY